MSRPPQTHPPKNLNAGTDAPPGSFEVDAEDRVEAILDAEDAFEEAIRVPSSGSTRPPAGRG